MNDSELIKIFIILVEYLNNGDNDTLDVVITPPDGGKLKCHFHYDVEIPD